MLTSPSGISSGTSSGTSSSTIPNSPPPQVLLPPATTALLDHRRRRSFPNFHSPTSRHSRLRIAPWQLPLQPPLQPSRRLATAPTSRSSLRIIRTSPSLLPCRPPLRSISTMLQLRATLTALPYPLSPTLIPTMHLHRRGQGLMRQVFSQVRLTKSPATRLLLHPRQHQCLHMQPRLVLWGVTLPLLCLIRRPNSHTAGRPRSPCILQTPIRLSKASKARLDGLLLAAESTAMLVVESVFRRTLPEETGAPGDL
jgi:hypothetical protein